MVIEQAAAQVPALFDRMEAREAVGIPDKDAIALADAIDAAIDAARAVDRITEREGLAPRAA